MSERVWKPGDVAMVTYRLGACTETNVCAKTDKGWDCLAPGVGFLMHGDVIEARPLVVIDPEDESQVDRIADLIRDQHGPNSKVWVGLDWLNLQAALREFANPTPPRPDEPTGLRAIVRDNDGDEWIHVGDHIWRSTTSRGPYVVEKHWNDRDTPLARSAVEVLSEGVTE